MNKWKYSIEFGGAFISIYMRGEGLVLKEPALVAAEPSEEGGYKVIALGQDAKKLVGKTKDNVEIFTPSVYGDHSNYEYSVVFLKHLLSKVNFRFHEDNVLFVVPCGLSESEKEKVLAVCEGANMGAIELVPSVFCSCVGEGRSVDSSKANMVVDIGGVSTEIAVINMSGILKGATVGLGGKSIDAAIVNCLAYTQDLLIGLPTAELLKNEVASLYKNDSLNMEVTGVDTNTKSPKTSVVYSNDIQKAIEPIFIEIVRAIDTTINSLPPEIVSDIINNKILIVGGGSKIQGFENFLNKHLQYPFEISNDAENVTILGAGKLLSDAQLLDGILEKV